MPIKGLTDRQAMFPELGTLRKGAPKTDPKKPGPDLDYFRFDTDDSAANAAFAAAFGDKPREIEIKLPFPTVDENFEAWREEYVASGLKHRCDGETCVQWLRPDGTYSFEPMRCPGGCKQTARLKIIIPALERFAYVTVTTTSVWDIITIRQNLLALEMLRGSLRGIPMILYRREKEISTPAGDGKRARRKKWLLSVEAKPEWVRLELAAQERAALPQAEALSLPAWGGDDDEDDEDETAPTDPRVETQNVASLTERIRAIFADRGKAGEWFAYQVNHVAGKDAEALADLLRRLEEAASKKLIEEIEGPLFKALRLAGVDGKEALDKIGQIAEGEVGLEQMDYAMLVNMRDGLNAWLRQLKQETVAKAA